MVKQCKLNEMKINSYAKNLYCYTTTGTMLVSNLKISRSVKVRDGQLFFFLIYRLEKNLKIWGTRVPGTRTRVSTITIMVTKMEHLIS